MPSLFDLLQSGQLPQELPPDPWAQLEEIKQRQAQLAQQPSPGIAVTESRPDAEMIPTREVVSRPAPGVPYAPPASAPAAEPATAPAVAQQPDRRPPAQPMGALAASMSRAEGIIPDIVKLFTAGSRENQTVRVLMAKIPGMDEETATTVARNPAMMKQILPQLFSDGGYTLKGDETRFNRRNERVATGVDPLKVIPQGGALARGGDIIATNAPRPPKDYEWIDAGNPSAGSRPIKGGPADERFQEKQRTDKTHLDNISARLSDAERLATEIKNSPYLGRVTGLPGALPNVPGFGGADIQVKIDRLKAKAGFDALQAMRDASKTGGALGNVSNEEGRRLENSEASLQKSQSEDAFKASLDTYIEDIRKAKQRLHEQYSRAYGSAETKMAPQGRDGGWRDLGGGVRIRERP